MKHKSSISLLCIFLCCFLGYNTPLFAQKHTKQFVLTGIVVDESTGEGIPFANLFVENLFMGTGCDVDGHFKLPLPDLTEVSIRVSSVGYATKTLQLKNKKSPVKIQLKPQSIELEEFTVTTKHMKMGSEVKIGQESLEYIQPTSITDIFQLLPGGLTSSNNMQSRGFISSRQAGADQSTSFGMGVSADGIPISNDGHRVQMAGFTGQSAIDPNNNSAINAGVDLRTLSTDHIESVTMNRGIAPAREGNLSSGQIKLISRKGKSPLRVRTKLDPLNKLLYVGKGFRISEKGGTLHVGADITQSAADIRETRSAYNRFTSQLNYTNTFMLGGKKIDLNQKLSYIRSFNNTKDDEEIKINQEKYRTIYNRLSASLSLNAQIDASWLDKVEFILSTDYTDDFMKHSKKVINPTITCIQNATEEGEHEGEYLPSKYRTSYYIDNRPFNLFSTLNLSKAHAFTEQFNGSLLVGTSLSYTKNRGEGAVTDPLRPPFPSSSYIRPRPNYDIPALCNLAYYVDSKLRYTQHGHELMLAAGVRGTQMFNLPHNYELNKKLVAEPRLQLLYSWKKKTDKVNVVSSIRGGFGIENKLPSIDYLYPDKVYQDFIALNAYFNDPSKRLLITHTKIFNPENPLLRENKTRKMEFGYDLSINDYEISLTCFREETKGGMEYFTRYVPVQYTFYSELKHPVDGRPSREDFDSYLMKDFTTYQIPTNSSKVIKKGLEYRFTTPKIDCLKSNIEVNGAYYKTVYTSGVPVMYRPAITVDNKPYDYVGYYKGFDKTYSDRFNTNLWINTHIPSIKLIFTNFIQIVWFESMRLGKDVDVYPFQYMDTDGRIIPCTPADIDGNPKLSDLRRKLVSPKYNKEKLPPSVTMNIKLTKEFSRKVRLSFFADNIFSINPTYRSKYMKTQRRWTAPFFGTELILNFF